MSVNTKNLYYTKGSLIRIIAPQLCTAVNIPDFTPYRVSQGDIGIIMGYNEITDDLDALIGNVILTGIKKSCIEKVGETHA